jgi:hypothetical protein
MITLVLSIQTIENRKSTNILYSHGTTTQREYTGAETEIQRISTSTRAEAARAIRECASLLTQVTNYLI